MASALTKAGKQKSPSKAGALPGTSTDLLEPIRLAGGSSKPVMVEVLRRHSRNPYVLNRLERTLTAMAAQQGSRRTKRSTPKPVYALARRMSPATQAELVAGYQAGATARDLAAKHGIAHTTVLGLLRKHGAARRPRGSKPGATHKGGDGRFKAGQS